MIVVYNEKSGSNDKQALERAFAEAGLRPEFISITSRQLRTRLTALKDDPRATVVAAGGDGTINSVTTHIFGGTCKLGIIPMGTLNHFAKALHIPTDLAQAARVIAAGFATKVDVSSVNSHVFVNNASIGFYPRSLRFREEYGQKIGKWPAAAIGLVHATLHPRKYTIDIVTNDTTRSLRTPFVFIGNNEYQRSGPGLGERAALTSGLLALYVVKATHPIAIINALLHTFLTTKRRTHDFAIYNTANATIHTHGREKVRVACDGELFLLQTPLHFASHPKALRVIIPRREHHSHD